METPRLIAYDEVVREVRISSEALSAIKAHAAADPRNEVCGLLLGTPDHVSAVAPTRNVAEAPACRFEIEPAALISTLRSEREGGPKLIGYYHSHPEGTAEPSATDRAMAADDGMLWLIVAAEEVRAWRSGEGGFEPVLLTPTPIH